jgi:hypothetical protein
MGPITIQWYKDRGLTRKTTYFNRVLEEECETDEITESYSGGRIDVYGLPYSEYYDGKTEYGLPIMKTSDFSSFSEWLLDFKSETLLGLEELVKRYEETNKKIEWWENES